VWPLCAPPSAACALGPWPLPAFDAVGAIVFLAILQLVLFALTALLGTIRNITQQLLQNAVAMRIQLMVMEKAATLDLAFYEDPRRTTFCVALRRTPSTDR
jgi:ABC-type bacteriocin/lantibiotic exporter with double-glycine peptidase domain